MIQETVTNKNNFKVGITKEAPHRLKFHNLLLYCECSKYTDEITLENHITENLKRKYACKRRAGCTYVEGKSSDIKIDIYNMMIREESRCNEDTIEIRNFGEENMDYITPEYLQKIVTYDDAIPKYMLYKYFNKEHRENHNIKFMEKSFYVKIEDKWRKVPLPTIIDRIYMQSFKELLQTYHPDLNQTIYLQNKGKVMREMKDMVKDIFYSDS